MKELGISFVRTSLVPPAVGFVLTFLTSHGITSIDSSWVFAVVTLVFSGVWYVLFRGIELLHTHPTIKRWAGVLLGYPRVIDNQLVPPVKNDVPKDSGQANVWTIVALIIVVLLIVFVVKAVMA